MREKSDARKKINFKLFLLKRNKNRGNSAQKFYFVELKDFFIQNEFRRKHQFEEVSQLCLVLFLLVILGSEASFADDEFQRTSRHGRFPHW